MVAKCDNALCHCYSCEKRSLSCCKMRCKCNTFKTITDLLTDAPSFDMDIFPTFSCNDYSKVATWEELAQLKAKSEAEVTEVHKKYPCDFVFDEDKSVRWNREEVERQNKDIEEARQRAVTEKEIAKRQYFDKLAKKIHNMIPQIPVYKAHLIYEGCRGLYSELEEVQERIQKVQQLLEED